jgi:hypothetical protein
MTLRLTIRIIPICLARQLEIDPLHYELIQQVSHSIASESNPGRLDQIISKYIDSHHALQRRILISKSILSTKYGCECAIVREKLHWSSTLVITL